MSFAGWLKNLLVTGVLSTDRPDHYLAKLEESGLWHSEVTGQEPDEQINEWLQNHASQHAEAGTPASPSGPKPRRAP